MALKMFGRYEIIRRLGAGGMGSIYLGKDPKIDRLVAIKILRTDLESAHFGARFTREARAVGALSHPNIVTIFDFGEVDGAPYIVMEYIPGETIAQVIAQKADVPLRKKLIWLEQLCSGLAYAHQIGIVHRDVKPANLMLGRHGALKILDFGIASLVGSVLTMQGDQLGTPRYMSPEQIQGQLAGAQTDIFAVGAVAYELLTFAAAFDGPTHATIMHRVLNEQPPPIRSLVPDVPDEVVAIVERALQKDPAHRFRTAAELVEALSRVRETLGPSIPYFRDADRPVAPPTFPGSDGTTHIALPTPVTGPTNSSRVGELEREARNHMEAGQLTLAEATITRLLELEPGSQSAAQLRDRVAAARHALFEKPAAPTPPPVIDSPVKVVPEAPPTTIEATVQLDRVLAEYRRQPPARDNQRSAHANRAKSRPVVPVQVPERNRGEHVHKAPQKKLLVATLGAVGVLVLAITFWPRQAVTPAPIVQPDLATPGPTPSPGAQTQPSEAALPTQATVPTPTGTQTAPPDPTLTPTAPAPKPVAPKPVAGPPANPVHRGGWTSPEDGRLMIWLRPGTFTQGSLENDPERGSSELPQRSAAIASGFWMDAHEVTNDAFLKFVQAQPEWRRSRSDPEHRTDEYLRHWVSDTAYASGAGQLPVSNVSWHAAAAYCRWSNKRLPTEAEWEYAARAEVKAAYWWGGASADDFNPAYANNSGALWPVGRAETRNPWGFFDMLGNVMEWTREGWLRGGAFGRRPVALRLAGRLRQSNLRFATEDYGFRCAR